ncbi:MAG TPA: hypothetical protein VMR31_03865 [Myxococcota bacterium]|nr:hypothetical protein [Myxococcota bacterium]
MPQATRDHCRAYFEPDGSLRDIYVFSTTIQDWQAVLDEVRRAGFRLKFEVDGVPAPVPIDVASTFDRSATRMLSIDVDGIVVNAHFFTQDEIELDIEPREVDSAKRFKSLRRFLALVGRSTKKPVVLTEESLPEEPLLRYEPDSDALVLLRAG